MKKRNLFMSTALMCGLFSIAFTFNKEGIHWFWSGKEPVAVVLVLAAVVLRVLWYKASRKTRTDS